MFKKLFKKLSIINWLGQYFLSHDLLQEYADDHVKLHVTSFGHQAQQIIELQTQINDLIHDRRKVDDCAAGRVRKIKKVLEYKQLTEG